MRSDVLSDDMVSATCQLAVQHPIKIGSKATVSRESLFSAFRAAADGRPPPPLKDLKGKTVPAKVTLDADGLGHVDIASRRAPVPFAELMTGNDAKRLQVASRILKRLSLARAHEEELLRLASKPDFSLRTSLRAAGFSRLHRNGLPGPWRPGLPPQDELASAS
jgi:hypothetical protein